MIASGPHGKLDEYLPVVDLLLSVRELLSQANQREAVRHASSLLLTAMDDLEFEFTDILRRRRWVGG